ncbi:MAG: NAD(P)-dependent methylenetetrahydromethanopterin dehydrogenase [Pseudomonadota bacterium]
MAERAQILHLFSPLKHASPFDINMALDAGFDHVVPYTNVELAEVAGLVQDAIFSRGPKGVKRTGVFIGGRNAIEALDMLETARKAMFPPFQMSVFADPAGSFTTAAALVACVEKHLLASFQATLKMRRVVVFGATGVVGFAAGVIAGLEGAEVTLVGYDGPARVEKAAADAKERFEVALSFADGSSDDLKAELVKGAEVIISAGRAGLQVLSKDQLAGAAELRVAADVNAVPPAGIEGLGVQDDGAPLEGTPALGIGPLAVGNVKYQVESGLFQRMIESDEPLFLDFRDAFAAARSVIA